MKFTTHFSSETDEESYLCKTASSLNGTGVDESFRDGFGRSLKGGLGSKESRTRIAQGESKTWRE